MARYAHIVGWGMSVPPQVLTNDDLTRMVDTSDEWIQTMTGIRERHIAGPRESTATLAADAAIQALNIAGVPARRIDLIIVATSLPEYLFPSTACVVQDQLGASNAAAFDLSAACSGFPYALAVASQMIVGGVYSTALVIGSETLSRMIDWNDRSTCVLFGDGAGAVVLQAGEKPGGVLSFSLGSDGSGGDLLMVPAGGSRMPASLETLEDNKHAIVMNGRGVYRFATRVIASSIREVVAKAGLALEDIRLIIPHQANRRIIESSAKELNLPMDRFVMNIDRFGNTSAASIPIALCEAVSAGQLRPGDNIVMVAFGAGLTWGSVVAKWVSSVRRKGRRLPWSDRWFARARSAARRTRRRIEEIIWGKNE
ncbi:MAG: ketoacyl-ACP synthase III [Anaerolineales bacterium]|nr:ketoacyl-ACP synthase III [Anaerolineales bacterium]